MEIIVQLADSQLVSLVVLGSVLAFTCGFFVASFGGR